MDQEKRDLGFKTDEMISFVENDFVLNFLNDSETTKQSTTRNISKSRYPLNDSNYINYPNEMVDSPLFMQENMNQNMYINQLFANMNNKINYASNFPVKNEQKPILNGNYFNKFNNLINNNSIDGSNYNYQLMENYIKPKEKIEDFKDKLDQKLAKNRESARNSRKRKKIYIEMLELKVAELNSEIESLKKTLQLNTENLAKLSIHSKSINQFEIERKRILEILQKTLIMSSPDDNDISLTIDSLRLRFGSFGCERTKLLNNIFKSFYDYAIPPYLRYLIYSSNNEKDVFNENDINSDENIINDANLNDIQMKSLLKFKKKMISSNQKLKTLFTSIEENKQNIIKETSNLENIIDELRNIITPKQIGKFLIDVEKIEKDKKFSIVGLFLKEQINDDQIIEEKSNEQLIDDKSYLMGIKKKRPIDYI